MLTVKIMNKDGGENIMQANEVGYNPHQKSLSLTGRGTNIFLSEGQVAYITNDHGRTVSIFSHSPS